MAKKKLSKAKQKAREKKIITIIVFCLFGFLALFVWFLTSWRRYDFVEVVFFPLWYVALGLGVIPAIFCVWWSFKKGLLGNKRGRGLPIGTTIIAFIGILFLSFFIFGITFAHLNHIFDPHEPERYVVAIEDEGYYSGTGRHRIGKWKFKVTINGEKETIVVPRLHAYQFREGDLYVVEYHKGAFNEPYYIGVGAPTDND